MVGCGLSIVGTEAESSSGGTGDGGREASSSDVSNESPDASPDAPSCDGAPTCTPADLVVLPTGQVVRAVAVTSNNVFFINATTKKIMRAGVDGSNVTEVVGTTEPARQLIADETYVWYTGPDLHRVFAATGLADTLLATGISGCVSLDPAKTVVYAADFDDHRIVTVPYAGILASDFLTADAGVAFPWGVAATDTDTYFTTSGARSGFIYRRPKAGDTTTIVKQNQSNPNCLTFDEAGSLYWVTNADGTIHRSNADGSDEVVIASGETNVTQIAVDEQFIYWGSENKVRRLAR